jgi:flagellar biosynthesis/type III secretory pathway protein FliH
MDVVSDEDDKKEKARERARNYYRIKQGIPIDAPLIQRGGAHNVKYHTEAEKAERARLEKEYQKEYQQKYREKKANELKQANEEPIKRTLEEFRDAILAKQNAKFDILINELVDELKQGK